ncbi:MAG: serine hydrolase domain-containing protein [Myxococcota bacterium]
MTPSSSPWRGHWTSPRITFPRPWRRVEATWLAGLVVLAVLIWPAIGAARSSDPQDPAALSEQIAALIDSSTVPGAAVAVVEEQTVVLARGFGLAVVAEARPMTATTVLRVGSLSKNLTTLAIMRLVAQGTLDLDRPIRAQAPDVALQNPWEDEHPVTLRHLLGHTAGLEDSTYFEYASNEPDAQPRDYARTIGPRLHIRWPPGLFFSYANPGHTLAAVALEDACDCSFDDYMEREVFAALGMHDSRFRLNAALGSRLARGYTADGSRPQADWPMTIRPSGAMLSTIDDLAKLVQWYAAPRGIEGRLVPDALLVEMETHQASLAGALGVRSSGYGLGTFAFSPVDGQVMVGHSGAVSGFRTWLGYLPGGGRGFVVVINGDDSGLRWRLAQLLGRYVLRNVQPLPPTPPVALEAAAMAERVGWYAPFTHSMELRAGLAHILGAVHVSVDDDGLRVAPLAPTTPAFTLEPTSAQTFREGTYPQPTVAFVRDPDGRTLMVRSESYEPVSAVRALGRFAVLMGATLIAVATLVFGLVRMLGRVRGRAGRGQRWSAALLVSAFCWIGLGVGFVRLGLLAPVDAVGDLGIVGPESLFLLISSILGPICSLGALWRATRPSAESRWRRRGGLVASATLTAGWVVLAFNDFVPLVTFGP